LGKEVSFPDISPGLTVTTDEGQIVEGKGVMPEILVTGANGFVGRELSRTLMNRDYVVRAAVRRLAEPVFGRTSGSVGAVAVGDIGPMTDWSLALGGVDTVVHLAARVHVMQEVSSNPLESFRSVNVHGTERLARMAVEHGVRRFVYISSISIHGNSTGDSSYREGDQVQPHSAYAVSKWEGELVLRKIEQESDMEVVIVRPPLVYGPGVGGNFMRLMQWAHRGFPLPLKSIRNKRSFIAVENLADLIECCVSNPNAAGETFVASDGEDLSTPELIDVVARLMGRTSRLIPVPVCVLRAVGKIMGKEAIMDRLCNSLRVNAEKSRYMLNWKPRISLSAGLERTVKWYMEQNANGGERVS
jgi:nucleoside-diphosphate-sugar epimerase